MWFVVKDAPSVIKIWLCKAHTSERHFKKPASLKSSYDIGIVGERSN